MTNKPTAPEVRLARLPGQMVWDGQWDKAILPLGATEYHGPPLPYGTDTITAEAFAEAFARELGDTLVLPALDYGVSHHHLPWKWTLSLRPDTLALVVRDIGESLLRHDIRKLLIVSAHDGNPPAATVAARILSQEHDLSVAIFSGWQGKARQLLAGVREIDEDHAGQSELSMVLYAAPETARLDVATRQPHQRMDAPVDVIGGFDGTRSAGLLRRRDRSQRRGGRGHHRRAVWAGRALPARTRRPRLATRQLAERHRVAWPAPRDGDNQTNIDSRHLCRYALYVHTRGLGGSHAQLTYSALRTARSRGAAIGRARVGIRATAAGGACPGPARRAHGRHAERDR